jgi:hypothetical protein
MSKVIKSSKRRNTLAVDADRCAFFILYMSLIFTVVYLDGILIRFIILVGCFESVLRGADRPLDLTGIKKMHPFPWFLTIEVEAL